MKIQKNPVACGIDWLEIPEAGVYILCGCPADSVKHLMKKGLIRTVEDNGVQFETGPNAILLSDLSIQNGEFSNLAEFPVLQMLYRQGMLLPNHPNNTGEKPILIGLEETVYSQMEYIYRGNYGLISEEEIIASGVSKEEAKTLMRLKLKFAFGSIRSTEDLLEPRIVHSEFVEIRNKVFVRRLAINQYEIEYKGETVTVNLNLGEHDEYAPPYDLGYHAVNRDYFAITHSGEGDGWDINRPCMASILTFQGRIYLIDAGPNITHSLNSLGIDINEIEGIFHTHAHDDHFSGLTTLIHSDHRVKYYATPLVRASVTKKLMALMSIDEIDFKNYFEVHDLEQGVWNNIEGLEVKPIFSPHPIETTALFFRTLWTNGYVTYAHLADISAFNVLSGMLTEDETEPGISKELMDDVKSQYRVPVRLKKIDIGGGLIHGRAQDFSNDPSYKIILSHTSQKLTRSEKEIGSCSSFGMTDTLIASKQDYYLQYAHNYLREYFPSVEAHELRMLLNCPRRSFSAGSIILKNHEIPPAIYLVLTGNVEFIHNAENVNNVLSTGSLIGDLEALFEMKNFGTYRAISYVETLKIPRFLFEEFVLRNQLFEDIKKLQKRIQYLQKQTWLFGEHFSYPKQIQIGHKMQKRSYLKGEEVLINNSALVMLHSGKLDLYRGSTWVQHIEKGDFCGEEGILYEHLNTFHVRANVDSSVYEIHDHERLRNIPIVRWKMLERFRSRKELADLLQGSV